MMYSHMRDQMMDIFDTISRMDVGQTPTYRFMVALCNRLKADGVPPLVSERLVTRMKITIDSRAGADEELMRRAVECYAGVIMRKRDQIQKDFVSNPYDILESLAHEFNLTMEF